MTANDSDESGRLLHLISDFGRIADHAVNILESAEGCSQGKSPSCRRAAGIDDAPSAVQEIIRLESHRLRTGDLSAASRVEPLEQVIDGLKGQLRSQIARASKGACSLGNRLYLDGPAHKLRARGRPLLQHCRLHARKRSTRVWTCTNTSTAVKSRAHRSSAATTKPAASSMHTVSAPSCSSKRTAGFPAVRLFSVTAFRAYSRGWR